jgi:hypothetical protein
MAFTNTAAKSDKLSTVGLGQPVGAHCNTGLAGLAMSYTIAGQPDFHLYSSFEVRLSALST